MTLSTYLKMIKADDGGINWTSPSGPIGQDWHEAYIGLSVINHEHAPSLKNPQRTKIPTASDGWHKGDSAASKKQARKDLIEIHKRLRRQIGKPEVAQTALFPQFPSIAQNM